MQSGFPPTIFPTMNAESVRKNGSFSCPIATNAATASTKVRIILCILFANCFLQFLPDGLHTWETDGLEGLIAISVIDGIGGDTL